eukprot:4871420-Pyramimonas_sp.AAC.1
MRIEFSSDGAAKQGLNGRRVEPYRWTRSWNAPAPGRRSCWRTSQGGQKWTGRYTTLFLAPAWPPLRWGWRVFCRGRRRRGCRAAASFCC